MWSVIRKEMKDRYLFDIEYIVSDLLVINGEESACLFQDAMSYFQRALREKQSQGMALENSEEFCEFVVENTKRVLKVYWSNYVAEYPSGEAFLVYQSQCEAVELLKDLLCDAEKQLRIYEARRQRGRGRRYHVHPLLQDRPQFGSWKTVIPELIKYPDKFKQYTRMSVKQFDFLARKLRSRLEKNASFREPIPPDARLMITLRHFATGDSLFTLSTEYRVGISTISGIIHEVCEAIWEVFSHQYIIWPTDLEAIAEKFNSIHKFPHCCGSVDGKHIEIQKPVQSGGSYYNYKGYHSIVLLGICDADCNFIYISIGSYGSQSDSSVFSYSEIGKAIIHDDIVWPTPSNLPNSIIQHNYFLIGDEAFPLSEHLLRPYSGRNLPNDEAYFNSRLSTARNTIERTFGILANRFRILRGEIESPPRIAEIIVKACATLHNYIRKTSDANTPQPRASEIRNVLDSNLEAPRGRPSTIGTEKRNIYKSYLYSQVQENNSSD